MAISTYAELQTAITDWMVRNDLSGDTADIITLAEARLNRKIQMPASDSTLAGVQGSRSIDISSLSIIEPVSLYIKVNNLEREIVNLPLGSFEYTEVSGEPIYYSIDGDTIDLMRRARLHIPSGLQA